MIIKCTFSKVRNSQLAKIHCTRPFNKRNTINTAVQNSTSSELVNLRRRASMKSAFSACGQYYPTAKGNSDAPETGSIVFLPFTKPARHLCRTATD